MPFKIMHVYDSHKLLEKTLRELDEKNCNIFCILPLSYKQSLTSAFMDRGAVIVLDQTWIFYEEPNE